MADDPFKGPAFYKRWWWQLRFSNPVARRRRTRSQLHLVGEDGQLIEPKRSSQRPPDDAASRRARLVRWARTRPFEVLLVVAFVLLAIRYLLLSTSS